MAEKTLVQRIALDGGADIRKELVAIGRDGEAAFEKLKAAAARAGAGGGLAAFSRGIAGLRAGFGQIAEGGKRIGSAFGELTDAGGKFGDSVEGVFKRVGLLSAALTGAVAGFAALSKTAFDAAENLGDATQFFGISAEKLQEFQAAATIATGSTEKLDQILTIFEESLAKTAQSSQTFSDKLVNGIQVVTVVSDQAASSLLAGLAGQPLDRAFQTFAQRVVAIEDPLARLKALTDAGFNRRIAADLVDIASKLVEGTRVVDGFSAASIESGTRAAEAFRAVGLDITRLKNNILVQFAPAMTGALSAINEFLIAQQDGIVRFGQALAQQVLPVVQGFVLALTGGNLSDAAAVTEQGKAILGVRDAILDALAAFRQLGAEARAVIDDIAPAFAAIRGVADSVAQRINAIFGTDLSGRTLLLTAAIAGLTGGFGVLASAAGLAFAALTTVFALISGGVTIVAGLVAIFGGLPVAIGAAILAAGALIAAFWSDLPEWARASFEALGTIVTASIGVVVDIVRTGFGVIRDIVLGIASVFDFIGQTIEDAFTGAISAVESAFSGLVGFVQGIAATIASIVRSIFASISSAQNAQASAPSGGGGQPFASGGLVRGPGTATSDSILARLSNKEYVQRTAAVRYYGVNVMEALNRMRIPRELFRGLRGFSVGGLADGLGRRLAVPRFAGGGLAALGPAAPAALHPVTIAIGGTRVGGLLAPSEVVGRLAAFAGERSLRSAGAAPSWKRA